MSDTTLVQGEITKSNGASANLFIAGWRPAIGWVCALGLLYQYVVCPLGSWVAAKPAPSLDMGTLFELLFGMLGLGAMRTYEKLNGVASSH